nr:hypothetical protein [Pseudoxanthomonas taiwanensis]
MSIFPIVMMTVLAIWAACATALAVIGARRLRRERSAHGQAQDRIARYRAALRRTEEKAQSLALQLEALQREHAALRRELEESEAEPEERPVPTVMIDCLDISGEIGTLFEHVARVATAIRDYSAYTRGHYGPEHSKARYDLLWLSDCLHTFDRVGTALAVGRLPGAAADVRHLPHRQLRLRQPRHLPPPVRPGAADRRFRGDPLDRDEDGGHAGGDRRRPAHGLSRAQTETGASRRPFRVPSRGTGQ